MSSHFSKWLRERSRPAVFFHSVRDFSELFYFYFVSLSESGYDRADTEVSEKFANCCSNKY